MKKLLVSLAMVAMLVSGLSLVTAGQDQPKSQTWTGWISDSGCGAKGMSADHKGCAMTCVKQKGAKWVLVSSDTKEVVLIHNQDAVKDSDVGHEVTVTGSLMDDKSIHVDKIEAAGGM